MTADIATKSSRRKLMMRDGIAFTILSVITAILFAITLLLFRSFSSHRAEIALEAGEAGQTALAEHRPHDAIASLRTALSYSPNQDNYKLLLARALGEDGRIDESTNYYLNLREARPGDGFINLQLARLARGQNKKLPAIDYYRAAIFGDWKGEGDVHRRAARLELANYLIDQNDMPEAQSELLIAASNARSIADAALDVRFGDAFLRSGDTSNALRLYQKAMNDSPRDPIAFEKAGRVAYNLGDFSRARDWLETALHESAGNPGSAADSEGDTATLVHNSERLLALSPDQAANRTDRITRELHNRGLAKQRLDSCLKQSTASGQTPSALSALAARWSNSTRTTTRDALLRDPANEEQLRALIADTETLTAQLCGESHGDDAMLLLLARRSQTR